MFRTSVHTCIETWEADNAAMPKMDDLSPLFEVRGEAQVRAMLENGEWGASTTLAREWLRARALVRKDRFIDAVDASAASAAKSARWARWAVAIAMVALGVAAWPLWSRD